MLEPPDAKKTKDYDGRRVVHVDRQTRVDTFRSLGGQRFSIILAQCDACRAERSHKIVQAYGNLYLITVNLC